MRGSCTGSSRALVLGSGDLPSAVAGLARVAAVAGRAAVASTTTATAVAGLARVATVTATAATVTGLAEVTSAASVTGQARPRVRPACRLDHVTSASGEDARDGHGKQPDHHGASRNRDQATSNHPWTSLAGQASRAAADLRRKFPSRACGVPTHGSSSLTLPPRSASHDSDRVSCSRLRAVVPGASPQLIERPERRRSRPSIRHLGVSAERL